MIASMSAIHYNEELNESQLAAVLYIDGPSLVIAGAGSGKTRVLTYKIAYLLEQGYAPSSILALTFTNKAAREMKERIAAMVGHDQARHLWMGTFHSLFARILRREAEAIGYPPRFTIYDAADSKSLINSIIKEMKLDDKIYKVSAVQSRISEAKNKLVTPDAYLASREACHADAASKRPETGHIYQRYWERCRQAGAMDFDDLLLQTYLLFEKHPEILEKYRQGFRYILVDEYQDTNFAQHQIVLQLAKGHAQICVVGDDAQSIYSFRGANIDNILTFTKSFQGAKIFKLEQNYRSTKTIVEAANCLIEKNTDQIRKTTFSEKKRGNPIQLFEAYSDMEEGEIVANKIGELRRKEHDGYNDFAILYRTNAQSRIFEAALRKRNYPYRIYGGLSFYQRKEIKDVIAYFRMAVNPQDEEAFKRIINYPARGIGDTTVNKIIQAAHENNTSLWETITDPQKQRLAINKGTAAKLQGFQEMITQFMQEAEKKNAYEIGCDIVKLSGIANDITQERTPEYLSKQENIEELMSGMNDFCAGRLEEGNQDISLADFLSEISLLSDQDTEKDEEAEKITLMTIHAAKGLEFKNVFIVGLEENLFPSAQCINSYRALEEERRLFYVAITRAEENCFLSFAKSRFRYGKTEFSSPSRFLKDIDGCYLKQGEDMPFARERVAASAKIASFGTQKTGNAAKGLFMPPPSARRLAKMPMQIQERKPSGQTSVKEGQQIEHERFGIGEIMKVEGTGDNLKATVRFRNAGEKQLLLKFARFKIIN